MVYRSSSIFSGVDPGLARAIEETARAYKKYRVEPFSGRSARPKNPSSLHPHGLAVDVNLYDPASNALLPNIGNHPQSAMAYQDYANTVYRWALQNDPELAKQLHWGGYFAGGGWPQDFMHLERGGNVPQGGTWQGGFTPAVMKKLGLTRSGGLGDVADLAASPVTAASSQQVPTPSDPRSDTPSSGRASLGGYADSPSESGGARFGGTGLGTPAAAPADAFPPAPPYPTAPKKNFLEALGSGLQDMGKGTPEVPASTAGSALPAAPSLPGQPSPSINPDMAAWQRQQLAMLMQRLNSGQLWI
jgi:hypothetical protein